MSKPSNFQEDSRAYFRFFLQKRGRGMPMSSSSKWYLSYPKHSMESVIVIPGSRPTRCKTYQSKKREEKEEGDGSYCCKVFIGTKIIWMGIDIPSFLCKPHSSNSFMVLQEMPNKQRSSIIHRT